MPYIERMVTCGIYRIRNVISGKSYVGQSRNIERRWKKHLAEARRKKLKTALLDAIRSYGPESFEFTVIEQCDAAILDERERYWIAALNSMNDGYNHLDGGGVGPRILSPETRERYRLAQLGTVLSAEHRARIGQALRGRKASDTARANMSAGMKGRKFSDEHRAKISAAKSSPTDETRQRLAEAQRGKTASAETKNKLSLARKGVPKSPEHRAKIAAAMRGNTNRKGHN